MNLRGGVEKMSIGIDEQGREYLRSLAIVEESSDIVKK